MKFTVFVTKMVDVKASSSCRYLYRHNIRISCDPLFLQTGSPDQISHQSMHLTFVHIFPGAGEEWLFHSANTEYPD